MENLSKQQFEEMKCWNKNTIVEEDERSNKMKIKKKKNVDDGSNKSFVKVPLLYSIYSHDTNIYIYIYIYKRSYKMIKHMPQLSKWQRYKPYVEARINGLMDGFYYQLGWA